MVILSELNSMREGLTVTLKEQVEFGLFADASCAVHVTVVTPVGKLEPEAGRQLTVETLQLSVTVGAG
jgi:hypothetical protein